MAPVKVDEEKVVEKYINCQNIVTYEPMFSIRGYTMSEYTEYVKISSSLIIAFNPN